MRSTATDRPSFGMHDLVLAIAAVAHTKSVTGLADQPGLARQWDAVAQGLKLFARKRLQGLT